jgi:hypothetical protein
MPPKCECDWSLLPAENFEEFGEFADWKKIRAINHCTSCGGWHGGKKSFSGCIYISEEE